MDETVLAALDLNHLLPRLTTGLTLNKLFTSGDAEGLKARHSLVASWDLNLRSGSAGILLELMWFHFSGDLLRRMEPSSRADFPECERRNCVISNEGRNGLEQARRQRACVTPRDER